MRIQKLFILVCLLALALPQGAAAFKGHVSSHGDAQIHWGSGEAVATVDVQPVGDVIDPLQARSMAVRSAVISARRALLEAIEKIKIDSGQSVGYYLAEDFEIAEKVRMQLQNSRLSLPLAPEEGEEDMQGSVTASVSLRGALAETLLPKTIQFLSGIPPKLNESGGTAEGFMEEPMPLGSGGTYTGVVIDARGLDVAPALCPVVYDADGVGVYGPYMVSRSFAVASGVAGYSSTDEWMAVRNRVGDSPLVVKAISRATATDPMISAQDAMLVRAVLSRSGIGDKGRVTIVLDQRAAEQDGAEEGMASGDMPQADQVNSEQNPMPSKTAGEPVESIDLEE